jgi:hypothetical protein
LLQRDAHEFVNKTVHIQGVRATRTATSEVAFETGAGTSLQLFLREFT